MPSVTMRPCRVWAISGDRFNADFNIAGVQVSCIACKYAAQDVAPVEMAPVDMATGAAAGALMALAKAGAGRAGAAKRAARRVVNWRLFIAAIWG